MSFLDLTFFPFTSLSDQLIHIADVALFGQHKTFSLPWVALASCPPQHHWYMCICCPTAQPSRRLPLGRLKLCSSITSPLNLVCRGALPSHLSSCFLTEIFLPGCFSFVQLTVLLCSYRSVRCWVNLIREHLSVKWQNYQGRTKEMGSKVFKQPSVGWGERNRHVKMTSAVLLKHCSNRKS